MKINNVRGYIINLLQLTEIQIKFRFDNVNKNLNGWIFWKKMKLSMKSYLLKS
jgi:hypothetical protein